jgi:Cdc6-like AAA superfamily ATPase
MRGMRLISSRWLLTRRDRGDDAITEADLNDARAQVKDTRVLESVHSLNRHEQLAAAAIVHKQFVGKLPARRRELYSLYAQFATEVGIESDKYRHFHNYIDNTLVDRYERGEQGHRERQLLRTHPSIA